MAVRTDDENHIRSRELRTRALAGLLVLPLVLCGCGFAQRHPAITAGIVGGVVGFGACEMDATKVSTCAAIGGGTALFLGGITALVTTIFDTTDHSLPDDEPEPGTVRVRTHTEPPPIPVDAGGVDALAPDAGP